MPAKWVNDARIHGTDAAQRGRVELSRLLKTFETRSAEGVLHPGAHQVRTFIARSQPVEPWC
jgi:hypothetical protein